MVLRNTTYLLGWSAKIGHKKCNMIQKLSVPVVSADCLVATEYGTKMILGTALSGGSCVVARVSTRIAV